MNRAARSGFVALCAGLFAIPVLACPCALVPPHPIDGVIFIGEVTRIEEVVDPGDGGLTRWAKRHVPGDYRKPLGLEIDPGSRYRVAHVEASEQLLGDVSPTAQVRTGSSSCGFPFVEGERYLIYATFEGELWTNVCIGTVALDAAAEQLKELRAELPERRRLRAVWVKGIRAYGSRDPE